MELPEDQTAAVAGVRQWTVDRLRNLRLESGFSQADVAKKMNIHFSRVGDFENNRSDYKASTVFRYAKALGVSLDRVFYGVPGWRNSSTNRLIVISKEEVIIKLMSLGYEEEDAREVADTLSRRA